MATGNSLHLEIDAGADGHGHIARFEKHKGSLFLLELLAGAGITRGDFVFRHSEWVKSSGFTKSVQVRSHNAGGVLLQLKPAGNGSCCRGTLIVDRDHYTPEDVYNALRDHVRATDRKREQDAQASPNGIDDATAEMVLLCVNEAHSRYCPTVREFVDRVLAELAANSFTVTETALAGMFAALAVRGLLDDLKPIPVVSAAGQRWLDDPTRGLSGKPPPAELPPPPPEPPKPLTAMELLEKKRGQIERLLVLPGLVKKSQEIQAALAADIEGLMTKLDAEKEVEKKLMEEVDEDAVKLLLGDK